MILTDTSLWKQNARTLTLPVNECLRFAEAISHLEIVSKGQLPFTIRGKLRWAAMRKAIMEPTAAFEKLVRDQAAKEDVKDNEGLDRIAKRLRSETEGEEVTLRLGAPITEDMILDVPTEPGSMEALSRLFDVMIDPNIGPDGFEVIQAPPSLEPVPALPYPINPPKALPHPVASVS